MASPSIQACTISGAQYLSAEIDGGEVCTRFQSRLAHVLGQDAVSSLEISIIVSKSGTIDAALSRRVDGEVVPLTTMSIDVMDRPLSIGDLDQLADAIANTLASDKSTA